MTDMLHSKELLDDITSFLETDDAPPGQDLYPDAFQTKWFFPLQRQRELQKMMQVARSVSPRVVIEIGTDKGGGFYHWCKCLQPQRAIACEIRGTPFSNAFEKAFPEIDFLWLDRVSSYSRESVHRVFDWLQGDLIDCLFIDGDKCAFDRDFDAYLPLMNPHGIAFMHDINDRGPTEAYRRVCSRGYRHTEIIDTTESDEAIAREIVGLPVDTPYEGWLRHWKGRSCGVGVIYLESQQ